MFRERSAQLKNDSMAIKPNVPHLTLRRSFVENV